MPAFVMITHLSADDLRVPDRLEARERVAVRRIEAQCPEVGWVATYRIEGSPDTLDIFKAPDEVTARRVARIAGGAVHAPTELWEATSWRFRELVQGIHSAA